MGSTYYEVLGVSPDASPDEIKTAYRDRVFETHPDHNDDPDASDQFKRVERAESVLTDEVERARYDRLGHEAYVNGSPYMGDRTVEWGQSNGSTPREPSGPSHHARQRRRRQRARAQRATTDGWWFDEDLSGTPSGGGGGTATAAAGGQGSSTSDADEFSYKVHDWTDDVHRRDSFPSISQSTLVATLAIASIYPMFVYSSLTPAFPLAVNAVIAMTTLLLVGYLLTMPRIAVGSFGVWSVVVTVTFALSPPIAPISLLGALTLAFFWVPFGYAIAVWWALRS